MTPPDRRYDALHERLSALERARLPVPARRAGRLGRLGAALVVIALALLIPLGAQAADPFTDLNPGSAHNDNIAAIQAAGLTKGCNPPDFAQ